LAVDDFKKNLVRELEPLHFKGKWRGSGSIFWWPSGWERELTYIFSFKN